MCFFLVSNFKWTNFVSLSVGSRNPYRTGPRLELRSHFDEGSLLAQVSFTEVLGTGGIGDWDRWQLLPGRIFFWYTTWNMETHMIAHVVHGVSFYMKVTPDYLAVVFFYLWNYGLLFCCSSQIAHWALIVWPPTWNANMVVGSMKGES